MIYEQRTLGADRVDTIRITLDTPPELIEQYAQDGYTEVMEHYLVLYKPPEKIVLQEKLDSIASALPDEIAVEHVDMYPMWTAGAGLTGVGPFINIDIAGAFLKSGGKIVRDAFHTVEIRPDKLGRISAHMYIKTTQVSKVAGAL